MVQEMRTVSHARLLSWTLITTKWQPMILKICAHTTGGGGCSHQLGGVGGGGEPQIFTLEGVGTLCCVGVKHCWNFSACLFYWWCWQQDNLRTIRGLQNIETQIIFHHWVFFAKFFKLKNWLYRHLSKQQKSTIKMQKKQICYGMEHEISASCSLS